MTLPIIFTVLGAILLAVFLKLRVDEKRIKAVLVKSFVSLCFIAAAFSSLVQMQGKTNLVCGALVIGGLIFGLLGDIWLDLKYVYREHDYPLTLAGFFVFGVGHILYIAALAVKFADLLKLNCILIPLGFAIFGACLTLFGEKLMKVKYGRFKIITAAYCAILAAFVTFSLSLAINSGGAPVLIMINIAGLFFLLSDFILNGTYFGQGKDRPVHIITNHVTYYIAQFMIALSLCLIK